MLDIGRLSSDWMEAHADLSMHVCFFIVIFFLACH